MDGVISDTQKIHATVEANLFREYGINITSDEITKKYAGTPDKVCFAKIFEAHGLNIDVEAALKIKWKRMMLLASGGIDAIPGAIKLINDLKLAGLKLGGASSSPKNFIELVLAKLGIKEKFDAITSTQEVDRGKPNPDIFLLAAKKINIEPIECVVIEDAMSGMIAAKAAGMACVGLISDDRNYPADLSVTTLENLSVKHIINLSDAN